MFYKSSEFFLPMGIDPYIDDRIQRQHIVGETGRSPERACRRLLR
jgi:hypothetical protein